MVFPYLCALQESKGGFDLGLLDRNDFLVKQLQTGESPKVLKTGTTICGVSCPEGVVVGADTRASAGQLVVDKACQKVEWLTDNIVIAGAGTAADIFSVRQLVSSKLRLHSLQTRRAPRVASAIAFAVRHLQRYNGYVSAYSVIGGCDMDGCHLAQVTADGFVARKPYVAMGSGSLNAITCLDAGFREDLTLFEAQELVARAITAGITNDMGSGQQVDLAVMKRDPSARNYVQSKYLRGYRVPPEAIRCFQIPMPQPPPNTTKILRETIEPVKRSNGVVITSEDVEMVQAS